MQYLNFLSEEFGVDETSQQPVNYLLEHNQAQAHLKRAGYHYLHMGNWWQPTRNNGNAHLATFNVSEVETAKRPASNVIDQPLK